jgi:hypothetical protein
VSKDTIALTSLHRDLNENLNILLFYHTKPGPKPGQALFAGFGLAWGLGKPKPPQAKPKPGLSGQAGPEQH